MYKFSANVIWRMAKPTLLICYHNLCFISSVSRQLSPIFKSNGLSLRVVIPQTSGFHYSIVHTLVTLETKFYVNDVIVASVMCIKLAQVKDQLSPTEINSCPPVHFMIPIIAQFQYFLP